jgi:hypothetical protein
MCELTPHAYAILTRTLPGSVRNYRGREKI